MLLSIAADKFVAARRAQRYSLNTLADYANTYKQLIRFIGDMDVNQVSPDDIILFLGKPDIGRKTAANYKSNLSMLWAWLLTKKSVSENIILQVGKIRPNEPAISPYSRLDISRLLTAASQGRQPARDTAIILLMLDTGIRVSELCNLIMRDMAVQTRLVFIRHGKGDKGRYVKASDRTIRALLDYIGGSKRRTRYTHVFLSESGTPCTRDTIRLLMERLGDRAGVPGCCCHRFRHTFATEFLRNGGKELALQNLLGHNTRAMTYRYVHFVEADIEMSFDNASPVLCWQL